MQGFSFTKIKDLAYAELEIKVDVIGVIINEGRVVEQNKARRTIEIADDSNYSVKITFWEDLACSDLFQNSKIVAIKSCKVGDYLGKSLTANTGSADIIENPECPETAKIQTWFGLKPLK
jgi:replication factor A1